VFRYIANLLGPPACAIHSDVFLMSAWHYLMTDIIVKQQPRMRMLRIQGERERLIMYYNEHVDPPLCDDSFEQFLKFLSLLYRDVEGDVPSFAGPMIEEYWTQDVTGHAARSSSRLVALYNFVILNREFNGQMPVNIYVPYCRMLATICQTPRAAAVCYNMLRNQLGPVTVTLDHIFNTLHIVHQNLRTDETPNQNIQVNTAEINGLRTAVELISAVVKNSEHARAGLVDHPSYNPVVLFVALLGCSLPIHFKAACIDTLSAFACTPDGALRVWQYMEAAKLVPGTTYVSVHPQPGMQTDLEEVESWSCVYPVTIAFLRLLDVLTDRPLPIIVGGPVFRNGFDPYMNYLREWVFPKFLNRTYSIPEQRWLVGSLCLKVMEKILRKFSCVSDNVLFNDSTTLVIKDTTENGAYLAYNLLGHLMQNGQLLRLILKIIVEGTHIIDTELEQQTSQRELKTCILLALRIIQQALIQQDNFLCEVRNSNASLIVTSLDQLLKGINPRTNRPDYCATFGKLVGYFSEMPHQALAAARILLLLTRKGKLAEHLAVAFTVNNGSEAQSILSGFAGALDLSAYDEPPPGKESDWNDAQLRTAIAQTIIRMIQQCIELHNAPNVAHLLLGFDVTRPLHTAALHPPGYAGTAKSCLHNTRALLDLARIVQSRFSTSLVELCYKLIYVLCHDVHTSKPVLRYLRSANRGNFFVDHLNKFPSLNGEGAMYSSKILMQQCWLLKMLAIELRMSAEGNQRSYVRNIVTPLVSDQGEIGSSRQQPLRRKLMLILDEIIKINVPNVPPPNLIHFDQSEVERLLKGCHYTECKDGPTQVDISALHDHLALEKLTEAVNMSGNVEVINKEIAEIVRNAVLHNAKSRLEYARKSCLTAWREVAGTIVVACPADLLGGEAKMRFLLEVSTELLSLINKNSKLGEALTHLTEVVLINMKSLAQLLKHSGPNRGEAEQPAMNGAATTIAVNAYAGELVPIAELVLNALATIASGKQVARSHLYTALLEILKIVKVPAEQEIDNARRSVGDRALNVNDAHERLQRMVTDLINSGGDSLKDVVCRDVCNGHVVVRVVALSLIDDVLAVDYTGAWLDYLSRKGYLAHLIESLVQDDRDLIALLERNADDRVIHVFVAKRRPANPGQGPDGGGARSELYQKVFGPVMQLLCAISSAVKCNNQDCISQLQNFLIAHSDIILVILQQRHNDDVTDLALNEMAYACKVVARAGSHLIGDIHQGRMYKMHETMVAILPWAIALRPNQLETTRLEMIEGILHSCTDLLIPTIYDRKACYLLFSPNLMATNEVAPRFGGQRGQESHSPLRLGLLVHSLPEFSDLLRAVTEKKRNRTNRLMDVNGLAAIELQELLPEEVRNAIQDAGQQRGIVREYIVKEVKSLSWQQSLTMAIIEQMTYILWRHLEFYLLHYVPPHETALELLNRTGMATEAGAVVTVEEVESLRASMANVFTESYFRRLQVAQGIIDGEGFNRDRFLAPSIRRLKELTQRCA
ncbi:protein kinase-like, partial [Tropilaelaps mercedesae]